MVKFTVFNELSLPLKNRSSFNNFFEVLQKLNDKGFKTIRMDREFKEYPEILPNTSLQKFFSTLDKDEKTKLRTFMNNGISIIESPLIKDEEIKDNEEAIVNEYFYGGQSTFGGLACADIWNTMAISFNSSDIWNSDNIILEKNMENIKVKHSSSIEHLNAHKFFFNEFEKYNKLEITQDNFWNKRKEFFPNKIIFCEEVEKKIKNIDKIVFEHAISILRDIEQEYKLIYDYNCGGEKNTVKTNLKMRKERKFTINDKKVFFENHIKSLPNGYRIYFLENNNKIYIGYIGKHLSNKRDKK